MTVCLEWLNNVKQLCGCDPTHMNCLSAKEWVKHSLAVWEFKYIKEDIRDKHLHPATFPIQLAEQVIRIFTHEGNVVLDPFMGSGTTLVASQRLRRHGIGFDLKKEYCDLAKTRVNNRSIDEFMGIDTIHTEIINDDCLQIYGYLPPECIDLAFTSPPYANLLDIERSNKSKRNRDDGYLGVNQQYSHDKRDFGKHEPQEFCDLMTKLATRVNTVLKPLKHFVINIADCSPVYFLRLLIPAMNKAGFILWNNAVWNKRPTYHGAGIFGYPNNFLVLSQTFEYVMDFVKVATHSVEQPNTIHGNHTTEFLRSFQKNQ